VRADKRRSKDDNLCMASSCCGGSGNKKQKLNNNQSTSATTMNGHGKGNFSNGYGGGSSSSSSGGSSGNDSGFSERSNGLVPLVNGFGNRGIASQYGDRIASPDMCFYCFDVLYSSLHNSELPKVPSFSNDALWGS